MGKETKRKDIVKYELPEVVDIKVGTEDRVFYGVFYVYYKDIKNKLESLQYFDTGREAINMANETYDKFKRGVSR